MPSMAPEAAQLMDKPDMNTYCPASGKKLRLKDLIPVRFTRVPEVESGYAMDPVTRDNFTNASQLVLLKPTGKPFTSQCSFGRWPQHGEGWRVVNHFVLWLLVCLECATAWRVYLCKLRCSLVGSHASCTGNMCAQHYRSR